MRLPTLRLTNGVYLIGFFSILKYIDGIVFFRNFYNEKIINIRLIASERRIEVTPNTVEKGLIYVSDRQIFKKSTIVRSV